MSRLKAFALYGGQTIATALALLLQPLRWLRRARQLPARSVWSGAPIINLAVNAGVERSLGYRSFSLVTHTYYTTNAFDYNLSWFRAIPALGYLLPFLLYVWACIAVDRLHFYCDRGFLPGTRRFRANFLELSLYRLLGIEIFMWTYGADVRSRVTTRALGEPNCCTDCTLIGRACICDEQVRVTAMSRVSRLASAVFAMGDMVEYTPGSRNDLFFWPVDLAAEGGARYRPVYPEPNESMPLRIVHAPNHRMFKGTRFLETAVRELQLEGQSIELVLVERVPNERALEIYRSADVIFDQCLVGFHGYFALEAMALGKPVMCYIRKPREYLLAPDECPIINVHVDSLKQDILAVMRDRHQLTNIGRRGRAYIEMHFTPQAFAARLAHAYQEIGVMR